MKKLSILLLAVVALLFVGMYNAPAAQAVETDVSFDVTVVKGNDITELPSLIGQFGKDVSFNGGDLVTDGYEFAYHILNGEIIRTQSHNVLVSGSTNLIVVVQDPEAPVTVYIDTNGELLGANTSATEPLSAPSKPHFDFSGYVEIEDSNVMVATYTRNNDAPAVNVTVNFGTVVGKENIEYNDVVTVQPNSGLGNFSYWADMDGQVISRNPNYAFSALNDVQIQAVFDEAENTDPVIYLSNVTGITPNAKSFLGYIEGDFVEYGVLASNKEEVLTLDTLDVTVIPSQALNPETNEFLRSIPETEDLKSFRAYAKLADGGVVYSENNFFMSKGSGGDKFIETFDNFGSNNYEDGTYNGVASSQWTYVHMRNQENYGIEGDGAMLRRSDESSSISVELINGIDTFSFDYRKAFTGNATRNYKVEVSNNGVTDTYELDTTSFASGEDKTVFKFIYSGSPLNGLVTIKIYAFGSNGNQQLTIDNFEWTEYTQEDVNTKLHLIKFVNNEEIFETIVRHKELLNKPSNPVKNGYKFVGWTDEAGNVIDEGMLISDDMTLTAKFEVEDYTLTFDSNGGTPVAPITGDYATDIVAPAAPTKEGYTFAGWSPALPETMPAGNQTYTAIWKAIDYTITFDSLDGTSVQSITAGYQSMVEKPVDPEKSGYVFMGWIDENLELVSWPYQMPLEGMSLTAQWQIVQDYTISFNVNFEGLDNPDNQTVILGELVVIPAVIDPEGYNLIGWAIEGVEPQTLWNFETDKVAGNMTLIAVWESIPLLNDYSITVNRTSGHITGPTGSTYENVSGTDSYGGKWSGKANHFTQSGQVGYGQKSGNYLTYTAAPGYYVYSLVISFNSGGGQMRSVSANGQIISSGTGSGTVFTSSQPVILNDNPTSFTLSVNSGTNSIIEIVIVCKPIPQ